MKRRWKTQASLLNDTGEVIHRYQPILTRTHFGAQRAAKNLRRGFAPGIATVIVEKTR